jgi:hypothetical protein
MWLINVPAKPIGLLEEMAAHRHGQGGMDQTEATVEPGPMRLCMRRQQRRHVLLVMGFGPIVAKQPDIVPNAVVRRVVVEIGNAVRALKVTIDVHVAGWPIGRPGR